MPVHPSKSRNDRRKAKADPPGDPDSQMNRDMKSITVYDMMTKDVTVIDSQNSLATLVDVLKDRNISGMPVVEHDELVGVISKRDVFRMLGVDDLEKISEDMMEQLRQTKVREMMKKPITILYKSSIKKAAETMKKHGINRLIVVDEDKKMIGIISKSDLVRGASKVIVKRRMETVLDEVLATIEKKGSIPLDELADKFHVDKAVVEEWARILEEHKLVIINYPVIGKPFISMVKETG